jgi:hypothetical protein
MQMNDPASRDESPLFSIYERLCLAMAAAVASVICLVPILIRDTWFNPGEEPWFLRMLSWLRQLVSFNADASGLFPFILFLAVGGATFCYTRRKPQGVVVAILSAAAIMLFLGLINAPFANWPDVSNWPPIYGHFRSTFEFFSEGPFLPFVMGLGLLCFAGELSYTARERVMREELQQAEEQDELLGRRVQRRQQLILAVLGPRMPVFIAVGRFTTQLVVLPAAVLTTAGLYWGSEPWLREVPAPRFDSVNASPEGESIHLRIGEDGGVYVDGLLVASAREDNPSKLQTILKTAFRTERRGFVLLQVDSDARCEWFLNVVGMTQATGATVSLAE